MALDAFVSGWEDYDFPKVPAVETAMGELLVEWKPGDYFEAGGKKFRGLTKSKRHIQLAERNGAPIGRTAIFDELMHVALWVTTGKPDENHEAEGRGDWSDRHSELRQKLKRDFS